MPLEISAGAGMEAIVFGTFGIKYEKESLVIQPSINEDIGVTTLSNIKFKGSVYAVKMDQKFYSVYKNGKKMKQQFYGEKTIIHSN